MARAGGERCEQRQPGCEQWRKLRGGGGGRRETMVIAITCFSVSVLSPVFGLQASLSSCLALWQAHAAYSISSF